MNSQQSQKSCRKYKSENGENTNLWIKKMWDHVPRRSKHPLSTSHKVNFFPVLAICLSAIQAFHLKALPIVFKSIVLL
jgi:hypothetical protein